MSSEDAAARWREERRESAFAHAEALARRQQAESAQARVLIAAFVARASADGPPAVPLRARSYDGRHRYRTSLEGWYLRRDESVAIDREGRFYVLSTPTSMRALLRGVDPVPQDPPLVLGAGGKDGESLDLVQALDRVLAG
ncbi:hypothetical protein [Cellulomonas soli]|uniref:Uncharacterized protein n=1 Tax=Cellulomonas soli TaxID=931535 RepID=A0A512PFE1_9CELL|nr:hypothetical protein [Cellulomonas soli]NYI59932.1 hypothetical protein [Cellulomonas soli]GEP69924.1 hypothetical protein CSO01_26390 [Cellulomonas soli]